MAAVELLLEGKTALITGGSRGIGAETVRLFRAAGARVAFSYHQAADRAMALEEECGQKETTEQTNQGPEMHGAWRGRDREAAGSRATGISNIANAPVNALGRGRPLARPSNLAQTGGDTVSPRDEGKELVRCVAIEQDLETPADGRALVEKAVAALGRLDILIVNHGIWPPEDAPIASMSDEQWRRTLGVNLDAVFGLLQAAVAEFEKQGPREPGNEAPETSEIATAEDATGHIVLISSTAGQRGEAFHADYAASKGALISLTKSLSSELAPRGIRVNCVAPGWVTTEMSAGTLADPELGAKVRAAIPVGRAATPREIAGPVLFLCTPLAGFISGEVLNVNGGAVLAG